MIRFLTVHDALFIHQQMLVTEGGGQDGVRDQNALQRALHDPQFAHLGQDPAPAKHELAAIYLDSLVVNRPFVDANKRTALGCALLFLHYNGVRFRTPDSAKVAAFVREVEERKHALARIAEFFHGLRK